jgi:hypothetical protein
MSLQRFLVVTVPELNLPKSISGRWKDPVGGRSRCPRSRCPFAAQRRTGGYGKCQRRLSLGRFEKLCAWGLRDVEQVLQLFRGTLVRCYCQSRFDRPDSARIPDLGELFDGCIFGRFINGYSLLLGFYSNLYPTGRSSFASKHASHTSHRFANSSLRKSRDFDFGRPAKKEWTHGTCQEDCRTGNFDL